MKLRAIDHSHVPAEDPPAVTVESFDEQLAATREGFAKTQAEFVTSAIEIAYELGRLRGIVEERNRERT